MFAIPIAAIIIAFPLALIVVWSKASSASRDAYENKKQLSTAQGRIHALEIEVERLQRDKADRLR